MVFSILLQNCSWKKVEKSSSNSQWQCDQDSFKIDGLRVSLRLGKALIQNLALAFCTCYAALVDLSKRNQSKRLDPDRAAYKSPINRCMPFLSAMDWFPLRRWNLLVSRRVCTF